MPVCHRGGYASQARQGKACGLAAGGATHSPLGIALTIGEAFDRSCRDGDVAGPWAVIDFKADKGRNGVERMFNRLKQVLALPQASARQQYRSLPSQP